MRSPLCLHHRLNRGQRALFALFGVFLSVVLSSLLLPFGTQQEIVLAVTFSALVLWLTEVVPLHVTALVIPFLLIVFGKFPSTATFATFFDPLIVLVLGGFMIAQAMGKHGIDVYIGQKLLHTGRRPSLVLLSLMAVTAFLSMWMANSAAAAIMLPIGVGILHQNRLQPLKSSFAKSLVLGIGYAATIGGLGTLVGSTPNILTAKFLTQSGIAFGFFDWFAFGFPLMIVLLLAAWVTLTVLFPAERSRLTIQPFTGALNRKQKEVLAIFGLTVVLWMTTSVHGIDVGTVSLVPVILLYLCGLLDVTDFRRIDWPALILIGGGIALGYAINTSGLDTVFASVLGGVLTNHAILVPFIVIAFGVGFTAFASNTAAAAVMVPFMIPLSALAGVDPRTLAVLAGVGVSLDFIMPSGTPPTTMAYSSGYLRLSDLFKAGIILSIVSILVAGTLMLAL